MSKDTHRYLISILPGALLLVGCSSKENTRPAPPVSVSGVKVETVQLQTTRDYYEAVGTIRSANFSVMGAQINGTVREIRVKPGDPVHRGQILAVLDDRNPRAQLGAAEAGVEESAQGLNEIDHALQAAAADRAFAEATYRRYKALLDKNSVTREEFDGAEARYKGAVANEAALAAKRKQVEARSRQARAQQESAETMYSYSRLVSPVDGIVTAKSVDAGTLVMPGTPVLTVEDSRHYRLEASLPEQFIADVRITEPVEVTTVRGAVHGRVVEIVPAADSPTRSFIVKIELPPDCACRSGEYGKASFPVGQQKRLIVPRPAIVGRGELEGLFVVNAQGTAEYRLVKTGKTSPEGVEVLSGLAEGERIATSQTDRLSDGVRVEAE